MHRVLLLSLLAYAPALAGDWHTVYEQSFDALPAGTRTGTAALPGWDAGSAAGVVFDGRAKDAGRFLVAASAWTSFNQGPIVNVDLAEHPHDRVRVRFDLYTFGDWRGLQRATGGPQHRLMFFDGKAKPRFAFDTNFATNPTFAQSWPDRNPAVRKAGTGGEPRMVDTTGRFTNAHRWPIEFEYPSRSPAMRFTFLCGAAAGSGARMPAFGIDNIRVDVRRTSDDDPIAGTEGHAEIAFDLERPARVSLGVYDRRTGAQITELLRAERETVREPGRHVVRWDGLDRDGNPAPPGEYEWRLLETNGFAARFVGPLGINPPSGHDGKFNHAWVGDHQGPGTVAVDDTGVYLGARTTEGLRQTLKQSHDATKRLWDQPQYYDGGRLARMAANGRFVFLLQPSGRVRKLDAATGRLLATWELKQDEAVPSDVDTVGNHVVLSDPDRNVLRWIDPANGRTRNETHVPGKPRNLTVRANGEVLVVTRDGIISVAGPGAEPVVRVPAGKHAFGPIDVDHATGDLYVVDTEDGERVRRYDARYQLVRSYGGATRAFGRYDPDRFSGIGDVAADGHGAFYVVEPGTPPRRVAHVDATTGRVRREWYGGQSFYVDTAVDRVDPTNVWGCAGEGFVHHYVMDYDAGTWTIRATYATGRLGDSLFPFAGKWRPVRRGEATWLVHQSVPAILRVDEEGGRVVPVALAAVAHNGGRRAIQFAGTGEHGFPKPFVAAARHHGYDDPRKAPRHFYWGDTDGDGRIDPEEFRLVAAKHGPNLISASHVDDDFGYTIPAGGYGGSYFRLPRVGWTGPQGDVPVWSWDRVEPGGGVPAVVADASAIRGLARDDAGHVYGAVQSGIMIREHGQFEGGWWPFAGIRRARLVKWDARGRVMFAAGRHSKDVMEYNGGRFYFPQRTILGPAETLIVSDQLFQPGTVWTRDGLYAGSMLDRAADDRPSDFHQPLSDDMQGVEVVRLDDGRVFWFMPYQGMNYVYEVTGWDELRRQRGTVRRPDRVASPTRTGKGLRARYHVGGKVAVDRIETPIHHQRFGPKRDAPPAPYRVEWTGSIEPRRTGPHRFIVFAGKDERVRIAIGDDVVFTAGEDPNVDATVGLVAGRRYPIRIDYANGEGRAELVLLWQSDAFERERLPAEALYAN